MSNESMFSLANGGLVLVYRPWYEHYNSQCVDLHMQLSCLFNVMTGSPKKGINTHHLDSSQHKHILKHVMVQSVSVLHPAGVIQSQQDHSYFHSSCVVQKRLSQQVSDEINNQTPQAPDMNPIKM